MLSGIRSLVFAALATAFYGAAAITLGQIDDFQDGTLQFWQGGADLQNIANGGPAGTGDRYLQVTSTGGTGPGSVPATFNTFQWSGDYSAAGVKAVEVWMNNTGANDLHMRIVLFGPLGSRWTSANATILPVGSGWRRVTFLLNQASLVRTLGSESYSNMISGVTSMMFRHDVAPPGSGGDPVVGQIGLDNILALEGARVLPNFYQVFRGFYQSGGVEQLAASDDDYIVVQRGIIAVPTESPVTLIVKGTAPLQAPASMKLKFETRANTVNIQQRVDVFNYTTGSWTLNVDVRNLATSDSTFEITLPGNPADYVQDSDGEVQVRFRCKENGIVGVANWRIFFDYIGWTQIPS